MIDGGEDGDVEEGDNVACTAVAMIVQVEVNDFYRKGVLRVLTRASVLSLYKRGKDSRGGKCNGT